MPSNSNRQEATGVAPAAERPRVTVREAAHVTHVPEREIQKAIEREEIRATTRRSGRATVRVLTPHDVVYLAVRREAGRFLSPAARKALRAQLTQRPLGAPHADAGVAEAPVQIGLIAIPVRDIVRTVLHDVDALRTMHDTVVSDPEIRGGEPIVRGTRVPVSRLAELEAQGVSREVMLEDHPSLTPATLGAALLYAKLNPRRGRPATPRPWHAAPGAARARSGAAAGASVGAPRRGRSARSDVASPAAPAPAGRSGARASGRSAGQSAGRSTPR